MITYGPALNDHDLNQILDLQTKNLKGNLSAEEIQSQGFVTVRHHLDLLRRMNARFPHIIAKSDSKVVGYALVMLPEFASEISILANLFNKINELQYFGTPLKDATYFIMGQICIAKAYRGKNIFTGLYQHMKKWMQDDFQYVITEVASENARSLRAHQKVGFETILNYTSEKGEDWEVILWDWH